jgi:hypothetical protein
MVVLLISSIPKIINWSHGIHDNKNIFLMTISLSIECLTKIVSRA